MKFVILILTSLMIANSAQASGIFSPANTNDAPAGMIYNVAQPRVINPIEFKGKRIAILASHGVQESELTYPYEYFKNRGALIDIVVPEWTKEKVLAVSFLKPTLWIKGSETFKSAQTKNYDLIILTGGAWNSTVMRKDEEALKLIVQNYRAGAFIAAVCSGPEVLIDARLVAGTHLTSTSSIHIDLVNAGAKVYNVPAMTDGKIITGRGPADMLEFSQEIHRNLNK